MHLDARLRPLEIQRAFHGTAPRACSGEQCFVNLQRQQRVHCAQSDTRNLGCASGQIGQQVPMPMHRPRGSLRTPEFPGMLTESLMRSLIPLLPFMFMTCAFADDPATPPAARTTIGGNGGTAHRYIIERTFPAGALDGVDAAVKKKVNENNATVGVTWIQSYANADKTKTYCEYEGPSEAAVRKAAQLNALPVDTVTEVPNKASAAAATSSPQAHRFIVTQTGKVDAAKVKTTAHGVQWLTSYASADKTKSYSIYEAPSEAAAREAATATGATVGHIMEVPLTLLPK
jgi:ribosomal protein S21